MGIGLEAEGIAEVITELYCKVFACSYRGDGAQNSEWNPELALYSVTCCKKCCTLN